MDAREIVAEVIHASILNEESHWETADKVLAALQSARLLDRTGALLTRAAELGEEADCFKSRDGFGARIYKYGSPAMYRYAATPADALEAAIAAAEVK